MSDDDIIDMNRWSSRGRRMPGLPNIPGPVLRIALGAIAVLVLMSTTFYQVQPEAVGVVLRFGRYVRTTEPGLHMKMPFAEAVTKVPVQRQLKQEFGFRTEDPGVRTQYAPGNFNDESMMLTGDLNVAIVEWIVQYRVSDPYQYLFKVRNPEETFRAMNEAIMRQVVGDRTVTEVLTVGRQEIETRVETDLQALAKQYELGITLDQVVLQDVNPPNPVKPSWDAVNQAQQQRDRLINEARAEYNKVVPRAKGEAEQAILQAQGYALDRVNRAQGDSARFKSVYDSYRKAPDVTRRRMYLETMGRVLPSLGSKVFVDKDVKGILPLLPLQNIMGEPAKGGGGL
jgi:membrane protease subunit HflK